MSLNKTILLILTFLVVLTGCEDESIDYIVSDEYNGPGIIFIIPDTLSPIQKENIILQNGLGKISESNLKRRFVFKSKETHQELEIVPIGGEIKTLDNKRCIYELVSGMSNFNARKLEIKNVEFYVGTKQEFINWKKCRYNALDYFDSIGVDWFRYYKE